MMLAPYFAICVLFAPGAATGAEEAAPGFTKRAFTYKTVDGLALEADVHREGDDKTRPVVVWLHGGALIVGSRADVPRRLVDLCRDEGYILVSFDYRLAPEVKLPAIVEDLEDGFRWLQVQGPRLFRADPARVVVTGGSAGGYLALTAGARVRPRPRAVVSYWGYGDVDGDWYTRPSEHYRTTSPLVAKEEALRAVGGKVLAGVEGGSAEAKARFRYYLYLRQNGLWTAEVTGLDPVTDRSRLDAFTPLRSVTRDYPPLLMVHGTVDDDVPFDRSALMAKELERQGVPHELVAVPGAGHGLAGGDRRLVEEAQEKALSFIRKHLR